MTAESAASSDDPYAVSLESLPDQSRISTLKLSQRIDALVAGFFASVITVFILFPVVIGIVASMKIGFGSGFNRQNLGTVDGLGILIAVLSVVCVAVGIGGTVRSNVLDNYSKSSVRRLDDQPTPQPKKTT